MSEDQDSSDLTPVEQAREIVKANGNGHTHTHTDDVYPWWRTLRRPLQLISLTVAMLCIGIIFLSITLKNLSDDRKHDSEQADCMSLFVNAAAESAQIVRKTASDVSNKGWSTLLSVQAGGEVKQEDVDELAVLVEASEAANRLDESNISARTEWVEAGQPLPCPITPESLAEDR